MAYVRLVADGRRVLSHSRTACGLPTAIFCEHGSQQVATADLQITKCNGTYINFSKSCTDVAFCEPPP